MRTIDLSEAQEGLLRLIDLIERGEEQEIVLSRNGRPDAKLVPLEAPRRKRIGVAQGQFEVPDETQVTGTSQGCFGPMLLI